MQVDESNQDSSRRPKLTDGAGMELEGLVMESEWDRLRRYSDCDFLMQVKQSACVHLDRFFLMVAGRNCEERVDTLRCASISPCGGSIFKHQARFVQRFGFTPGLAFDLSTGWDLNDPAQRARMWTHLQHERPVLIVGSWSGHSAGTSHMRWMMGNTVGKLLKDVSLHTTTLESCLRL